MDQGPEVINPYNLKRMITIFGVEPLMAAIRA